VLSGRGLCDELITRPGESYRLCCVVVCDLETSRTGAPYMYDISRLRVKGIMLMIFTQEIACSNLGNENDFLAIIVVQANCSTLSPFNVTSLSSTSLSTRCSLVMLSFSDIPPELPANALKYIHE